MNHEMMVSLGFFAMIGAGVWLHGRLSTEGRVSHLVQRQGKANALNLIGAAYAERKSRPGYYEAMIEHVREHRQDALQSWTKMTAAERDELGRLALALLGPGGSQTYLERLQANVRRGLNEMEHEMGDYIRRNRSGGRREADRTYPSE